MSAITKINNRFTVYPRDASHVSEIQRLAVGFQLNLFPEQHARRLVIQIRGTTAKVNNFLSELRVCLFRQNSRDDFQRRLIGESPSLDEMSFDAGRVHRS